LRFAGLGELLAPLVDLLEEVPERQRAALRSSLSLGDAGAHSDLEAFVAATSLLRAASASGPVLCLVDDVHWVDAASADALLFASRRLSACPVGFVFAARDDLVSRLDARSIVRLPLGPLDQVAAESLVRATNPALPAATRVELIKAAEGFPLALIEFARLAGGQLSAVDVRTPLPVSERIERVYGYQARRLPGEARLALVVSAVSDQQRVHDIAPAITQLGCSPAALDAAIDSGLVRVDGDRYVFRHPLARSAVYHAAGQAQRRAARRALADALADPQPELSAWHRGLSATAADEQIALALERTAESARRRGGRLAEARALELAARLSPADDVAIARLLAAGGAALQAGKHVMARALLGEVAHRSSDVRVLADAHHLLAQLEFWQAGRVSPDLVRVAEQVEPVDRTKAARLLSFALVPLISDCRVSEALPLARRAWSLIDGGIEPFEVAFRVAHVLVMAGEAAGAALTRDAAAAADRAGDLVAMIMISQPLWWLENYDDARRLLRRAIKAARDTDAIWMLCHGLINEAELERRTGRPVLARAAAAEALGIAEQVDDPMQRAEALVQLAAAEAQLGDAVQARAHADQARRLVEPRAAGATELQLTAAHALARAALLAGRPAHAADQLQPLIERVIAEGLVEPGVIPGVIELVEA
jgi:hypothetical protein